jgi:hypothetical protein
MVLIAENEKKSKLKFKNSEWKFEE